MVDVTDTASPSRPTAADALVDALAESAFVLMAALNRLGAAHDLSPTQLRVLGILRDREQVRVTRLAAHLGLEKSTLTGLVDRGVRRGLLVRTRSSQDGRAVDVSLSAAGRELADRLHEAFAAEVAALTGGLTAADRHRLATLTRRLLDTAPRTGLGVAAAG